MSIDWHVHHTQCSYTHQYATVHCLLDRSLPVIPWVICSSVVSPSRDLFCKLQLVHYICTMKELVRRAAVAAAAAQFLVLCDVLVSAERKISSLLHTIITSRDKNFASAGKVLILALFLFPVERRLAQCDCQVKRVIDARWPGFRLE